MADMEGEMEQRKHDEEVAKAAHPSVGQWGEINNEMWVAGEFREKVIKDLEQRKRFGIQKSDVVIHVHPKGEDCIDGCSTWKLDD